MDLKEFNQIKEKLKDTEAKIYEAFGIANYLECSKCGQKVSRFDLLKLSDKEYAVFEPACPLCQAIPDIHRSEFCDSADELDILEYYLHYAPDRIEKLYKIKLQCEMDPYERDFTYSELIVDIFIALEAFVSKIISKKLKDKFRQHDSIVQYIVGNMKPNIRDYIDLLEICGFENVEKIFGKLRDIWDIRNNIVHRGYKADFTDFAKVYVGIGNILASLQRNND